ncbi:MAG: hypothetical protein ACFFKA_04360, partial [Candidatus Thorarchaeota archaeon]
RPNLNYVKMKEELEKYAINLDKLKELSEDNMINSLRSSIDAYNEKLKIKYQNQNNNLTAKCSKYGLYLGMVPKYGWIDMI